MVERLTDPDAVAKTAQFSKGLAEARSSNSKQASCIGWVSNKHSVSKRLVGVLGLCASPNHGTELSGRLSDDFALRKSENPDTEDADDCRPDAALP